MKLWLLFLSFFALRATYASPFFWITDSNNSQVLVVDVATNTVVRTITSSEGSFSQPNGIAITPDGQFAYIFNVSSSSISVINTSTFQLVSTISLSLPISSVNFIAVSPNGAFAYTANGTANSVCAINIATGSVHTITGISGANGVAFSSDSAFAYVTSSFAIYQIDTSDFSVTTPFTATLSDPRYITVAPNGNYAYVSNFFGPNVVVLDLSNYATVATISLPGSQPIGVTVSPDGGTVYVADSQGNQILLIDALTNTLLSSLTYSVADPLNMLATPKGQSVYTLNRNGPLVSKATASGSSSTSVPDTSGSTYLAFALIDIVQHAAAHPSNRRP